MRSFIVEGPGSSPGWGTKILQAMQRSQKKEKKQKKKRKKYKVEIQGNLISLLVAFLYVSHLHIQ